MESERKNIMNTDFYGPRGQAIGKAARAYEEIMGRMLSRAILDDIGYYIDHGAKVDLIIKAIDITAGKGADWRYTKAILQRCIQEGIYDEYTYDFKVRYKKALVQFKREFPQHSEEPVYETMYLAVKVFREDLEAWEKDADEYAKAVLNGGDTSKWDERWGKFSPITYEMVDAAKLGAAEMSKAHREKRQSPF